MGFSYTTLLLSIFYWTLIKPKKESQETHLSNSKQHYQPFIPWLLFFPGNCVNIFVFPQGRKSFADFSCSDKDGADESKLCIITIYLIPFWLAKPFYSYNIVCEQRNLKRLHPCLPQICGFFSKKIAKFYNWRVILHSLYFYENLLSGKENSSPL